MFVVNRDAPVKYYFPVYQPEHLSPGRVQYLGVINTPGRRARVIPSIVALLMWSDRSDKGRLVNLWRLPTWAREQGSEDSSSQGEPSPINESPLFSPGAKYEQNINCRGGTNIPSWPFILPRYIQSDWIRFLYLLFNQTVIECWACCWFSPLSTQIKCTKSLGWSRIETTITEELTLLVVWSMHAWPCTYTNI